MSWQLKSDKTGKLYDFADDVQPADALKYLDEVLEKSATWEDVKQAFPKTLEAQRLTTEAGMLRLPEIAGQLPGVAGLPGKLVSQFTVPQAQEKEQQAEQLGQEAFDGKVPSTLQKGVAGAGASLIFNAPSMLTGAGVSTALMRKGVAAGPAISKGFNAMLTQGAATEGVGEFSEQRQAEQDVVPAALAATFSGLAEVAGERLTLTPLKKIFTGEGQLGKAVFDYLIKDQVGEQLTTSLQWLNRKMTREPDLTVGDLIEEAKVTAITTGIAGPVQVGVQAPLMKGAIALGQQGQPQPERIEPTDTQFGATQPAVDPGAAVAIPTEPDGKTRLVRDEELPIIGQSPAIGETNPRQLPIDQQLELLRAAYQEYRNSGSFQDTAEDKIRRRQEFVKRRTEVEQNLMFDPEGRAFVLATDLEMGLTVPSVETNLEQEVNEIAVLSESEVVERRVARETEEWTTDDPDSIPDDIRKMLGITNYGAGIDRPGSEGEYSGGQATQEHIYSRRVLLTSNANLQGLEAQDALMQAQPEDIVYVGQPGQENIQGASWFMEMVRALKETYLPDRTLFIGEVQPNATFASRAWPVNKTTMAFALPHFSGPLESKTEIGPQGRPRLAVTQNVAALVDTVLHEFTHLLHMRHWKGSSTEEKRAVAKEYHDDLRFVMRQTTTVAQAINRLYSQKTAEWILDDYKKAGGDLSDIFTSFRARQLLPMYQKVMNPDGTVGNKANYWFNFSEWMAHKGVRYFTQRMGVRKENVGFFRRLIAQLKNMFDNVVNKFVPAPPAFSQWLDNIAMRESGALGVMSATEIEQQRQELIAAGVDESLAGMLTAVRGTDRDTIRQIKAAMLDQQDKDRIARAEIQQFQRIFQAMVRTKEAAIEHLSNFNLIKDLVAQHGIDAFQKEQFVDALMTSIWTAKNVVKLQDIRDANGVPLFTTYGFYGRSNEAAVGVWWDSRTVQVMTNQYTGTAAKFVDESMYNYVSREFAKRGTKEFRVVGETQERQVPFWHFDAPLRPQVTPPEAPLSQGLYRLAQHFGMPQLQKTGDSVGWFVRGLSKVMGAYELIKKNEHIPGMQQERTALRNRMAYRHKWLSIANDTVERWGWQLPKDEAAKLSRLLFEEAESGNWMSTQHADPNRSGAYVFILDPQVVSQRRLSQEAQELYSQIRNDFMMFAEEWQKVGLWEISRGELSDVTHNAIAEVMRRDGTVQDVMDIINLELKSIKDPNRVKFIKELTQRINDEFNAWKKKPYMPFSRFGRYGVLVRDEQKKNTKYFEAFDTQAEAHAAMEELKGQFPTDAVSSTYLEDVPYMLAGLPPVMLEAMQKTLNLDQNQRQAFSELLVKLSHANSFVHRQARKTGVEGYSHDAMRVYSDYFRRGSAYIARIKSEPELNDAMKMLRQYISNLTENGNVHVEKLGQLHEWFGRHHKYLNDPGTEFGELKSFFALWYFGFNPASAMMNMLQVPFVTLPWMSERFGTGRALAELKKAYADVAKMYMKKGTLAPDEIAMLDDAKAAGFRDESQATVLAQLADGSALARVGLHTKVGRGLARFNHYAMWMFSKAELVNRDVTLLANYRLQRRANFNGKFDVAAAEFARTAVEDTHNEYAMENRPEIMRGAGSVIFQFMHYVQHMIFMMFGGDDSWKRLLAVQLFIGGLMGLPFARDAVDAAKFMARKFGKDFDLELEARKYINELGADPDLFMRGAMSNVFGADLSRRISLGEVIPGMGALGSHRKFEEAAYGAVGDVGGAGASVVINLFKFIAEEDKASWKAWRLVMPAIGRYVGDGAKAFKEGKVTDRSGATIFEPDAWDLLHMTVGFPAQQLTEEYTARSFEAETAAYWKTRRKALLSMHVHVMVDRKGDREGLSDFMKRIREYNENIPDPDLRITGETLRSSLRGALRARMQKEAGLGNPALPRESQRIRETFRSTQALNPSNPERD